jgi:hypothetical protein
MTDNLTFFIQRLNHFKTLGPLIDEAMGQGLKVNLILFQLHQNSIADEMFGGTLTKDNLPIFKYGKPNILYISDIKEIANTVIKIHTDVFIQHQGIRIQQENPKLIYEHYKISSNQIIRVAIMSHFYDNCFENLEFYKSFDKCFILSQYSFDTHKKILENSKLYPKEEINDIFNKKIHITGSALFDNFMDIFEYRKNNKIPKKDVIFLTPKNNHPFLSDVVKINNKAISLFKSIFLKKGFYIKKILKSPSIKSFITSLYLVTKSNKLNLIIKSRIKHKDEKLLYLYNNFSDTFMSGKYDKFYPNYTTSEIMKSASCIIGYQTGTIIESVISGVPAINIEVPLDVNCSVFNQKHFKVVSKYTRNSKPGNLFNFDGCVWSFKWEDALKICTKKFVGELRINESARSKYIDYYCGIKDEKSAVKQINIIKNLKNDICYESSLYLRKFLDSKNIFLKDQNLSPSPFWQYDINYKKTVNLQINNLLKKFFKINIVKTEIGKDRSTISYNLNPFIEEERNKLILIKLNKFINNLKLKKLENEELINIIRDFNKIYRDWPYDLNGSINYNSALHLYLFVKIVNPDEVIESGTYRGFSSYIIDHASKEDALIHCFDLNLKNLKYKSKKAIYYENDIMDQKIKFSGATKLAFFDDHCDHFSRLIFSKKNNIKYCVFDDDVSYFNIHSDGTPPLPSLNMMINNNNDYGEIEWMCNGRLGKLNFSKKLILDKDNYIYFTPEDLFYLTGIKPSSITSFLIHKEF